VSWRASRLKFDVLCPTKNNNKTRRDYAATLANPARQQTNGSPAVSVAAKPTSSYPVINPLATFVN
jgi:hypothetical protein